MKKLIYTISILLLTASVDAKSLTDNKKQLTNTLGQKVSMNEIIDNNKDIILIFWDSNNRNHIDILEKYQDMDYETTHHNNRKIIAICSDKHHNYQQLNAYISGKGWDIELYIDVNNSYKRSKGLLDRIFYAYDLNMQSTTPNDNLALPKEDLLTVVPK